MFDTKENKPQVLSGKTMFKDDPILSEDQKSTLRKMYRASKFFIGKTTKFPFRGFSIIGKPGVGKTFLTKVLAYKLGKEMPAGMDIKYIIVDSANIAASKWGEAEKNLTKIFDTIESMEHQFHIVVFDDIDTLFFGRSSDNSREYHASINSVMFHRLDAIKTGNCLFIATTNRKDLLDDALRSRLYPINMNEPTASDLKNQITQYASELKIDGITDEIFSKLPEDATYRDLENAIMDYIIDGDIPEPEIDIDIEFLKSVELNRDTPNYSVPVGTIIRYDHRTVHKSRKNKTYILYSYDKYENEFKGRKVAKNNGKWQFLSTGITKISGYEIYKDQDSHKKISLLGIYGEEPAELSDLIELSERDLDKLRGN